jgi:geranylgeranyl pyrophosphate synthase
VTLAAIVELVHLATLVHDDAVDHSVLRRGMPTVNALWNHQTAVIMGDYLYSRSISALADSAGGFHLRAVARGERDERGRAAAAVVVRRAGSSVNRITTG